MPSAQEIAAKLAHISGQLIPVGKNAQMKEWYMEYEQLVIDLKAAKDELKAAMAMQTTASKSTYDSKSAGTNLEGT